MSDVIQMGVFGHAGTEVAPRLAHQVLDLFRAMVREHDREITPEMIAFGQARADETAKCGTEASRARRLQQPQKGEGQAQETGLDRPQQAA